MPAQPSPEPSATPDSPNAGTHRAPLTWLVVAQLLCGMGIASGVAVGGVLAEQVAGTAAAAGSAQTASIIGAGLLALPLSTLASRYGRRGGLAAGFGLGALGAVLVLLATLGSQLWLLLLGMGLFGSATAAGLQSRYAAGELSRPQRRATAMSVVIWSTTVGSVIGPNLSQPGSDLGERLGIVAPGGPYLISAVVFVLAALVMLFGLPRVRPADAAPVRGHTIGALTAALREPGSRLGIVAVVTGHAMMVAVMVMTPVHMNHQGMSLVLVGLVISIHILGMYAASPLFGALTDRIGARWVIGLGAIMFVLAFVLGATAPESAGHHGTGNPWQLMVALSLLGLGWSACLIGGSSMIAGATTGSQGIRLQGAVDSAMSLIAAIGAALSGPVLAVWGYAGVNVLGAVVLLGLVAALIFSRSPRTIAEVRA